MTSHVHPIQTIGASRKRKECEPSDTTRAQPAIKSDTCPSAEPPIQPVVEGNNRLLAGYLAHEFLTRGTLVGKQWEPGLNGPASSRNPNPMPDRATEVGQPGQVKPGQSYADVSHLLMRASGAHISGVVNPTQLARWLQM